VRKGLLFYVSKRLLVLVPQLLAISIATFLLIQLLPGDPATFLLGPTATPEAVKSLRASMGLNKSLPDQYWIYVQHAIRGDLGRSWFTGQPVGTDLIQRAPATLELITLSISLAVIVGVTLGVILALRGTRGVAVRLANIYLRLAGSFPDFWLALVATYIFFFKLRWLPAPLGRLSITSTPPPKITGFYTIDSLVAGQWGTFADAVLHLVLPVGVLGLVVAPGLARLMKATMEEILTSDYMRYARANGLARSVLLRYGVRNALPPLITMVGTLFVYLLGGAVLIERIFSLGGVGQYAVQSVLNSDFAAIQGFVLLAAIYTVIVYLVVDLLLLGVDPRIRRA
jgi:ABC-type dipeptide/oligopeptide/nickel transport system permease component